MKWNHNGIVYRRGCYEVLIAQYDGCGMWYVNRAMQTQQSMKANFKRLGEYLNAKTVEVKKLYNDNDEVTEVNIIVVDRMYDGSYRFYSEVRDGLLSVALDEIMRDFKR